MGRQGIEVLPVCVSNRYTGQRSERKKEADCETGLKLKTGIYPVFTDSDICPRYTLRVVVGRTEISKIKMGKSQFLLKKAHVSSKTEISSPSFPTFHQIA
jgi:hypothetical protein